MDTNFSFNNNQLIVNNYHINFPYPIRDAKVLGTNVIVLLSIPYNDSSLNNLFSVNGSGEVVWQSQNLQQLYPVEKLLAYEQMVIHNQEIRATDFYGRRYFISAYDGKILKRDITK